MRAPQRAAEVQFITSNWDYREQIQLARGQGGLELGASDCKFEILTTWPCCLLKQG